MTGTRGDGRKNRTGSLRQRACVQTGVRWIRGELLMVCGALLSGWRGGSILIVPDGAALIRSALRMKAW